MAMVSLPSDSARLRFHVLRRDCGMTDDIAGNEIWTEYDTLKNKFAMEGDPIHWLACGTYVHILEHSLHADIIHLLKASKMNVPVFFFKLKRMLDIVGKTSKYKNHVAALEDEFNVAKVIFDKLDQLFADILEFSTNNDSDMMPSNMNGLSGRSKSIRTLNRNAASSSSTDAMEVWSETDDSPPPTLPELFHFIWVMFIWLKQHERCGALKDDLLNCFHILVCCFDCVITELYQHEKLSAFLKHSLMKDETLLRNIESGVGIISWLCTRHVAISDEALLIQSKWLMPLLEEEIETGRLRADVEEIDINTGSSNNKRRILRNFLFPAGRFQHNLNFFSGSYAKITNATNAFDERALLLSSSSKNVVINGEMEPTWIAYNMHQRHDAIQTLHGSFPADSYRTPPASPPLEHMVSVTPSSKRASMFEKTPLTAKGQLPGRNANREKNEMSGTYTNVTSVLLRVRELVALLQNRTNRASPTLLSILRQYDMLDVERELTKRLRHFGSQFLAAYEVDISQQHQGSQRLGAITTTTSTVREPAAGGADNSDIADGENVVNSSQISVAESTKPANVAKTFALRRLALTQILFWKLVEAMVVHELQRGGGNGAAKVAGVEKTLVDVAKALQYLKQDQFARNLFALCLEIVLFCHQSNKKFPWTLNIFSISAFDFGLFTEFIIRAEPCLPRDVLRHLHRIEEQVYEELIWRDDSKLWTLIDKAVETTGSVPSFKDVAGRNQLDDGTGPFSPYRHARIQAIKSYMRKHSDSKLMSAAAARNLQWMNSNRLIKTNGNSRPLKRGLDEVAASVAADGTDAVDSATTAANNANKVAQQSLAQEFDTISSIPYDKFTIVNGNVMMMPDNDTAAAVVVKIEPLSSPLPSTTTTAVSRNDADQLSPTTNQNANNISELTLVLRKVYSIMAIRLRDFCDRLDIISTDVRQFAQLWSALDLIFRSILPVLKNRHLDQLILCTIYVLGRLRLIQDKTFQDILTAYRAQPQASSVVYRQVYIGDQEFINSDGTKTILEERADIINFYNAVFLKQIQLHVAALREQVASMASPLPKIATRASNCSSSKLGPNVYCSIIPSNYSNTSSMTDIVNNNSFGTSGSVINYNPNSSSNNNMPSQGSTWSAGSGGNNNMQNSGSKTRNNPLVQSPHRIVVRSRERHLLGIGLKPEIRQLNRALDLASLSSSSTSTSSLLSHAVVHHSGGAAPAQPKMLSPVVRRLPIISNGIVGGPAAAAVASNRSSAASPNNIMPTIPESAPSESAANASQSALPLAVSLTRFALKSTSNIRSTGAKKFAAAAGTGGRLPLNSCNPVPMSLLRKQALANRKTNTLADLLGPDHPLQQEQPMLVGEIIGTSPSASQLTSAVEQQELSASGNQQNLSPNFVSNASPSTDASNMSSSSAQGGDEEEEEDDDNLQVDQSDDKPARGSHVVSAQTTKQFDSLLQSSSSSPLTSADKLMSEADEEAEETFEQAKRLQIPAVRSKILLSAPTTKQFGDLLQQASSPQSILFAASPELPANDPGAVSPETSKIEPNA